jgi:uncharacterized membrane protein
MVITAPTGLFTIAAVLDIVYMASGRGGFATAAGYVIGLGLVAGLVAAVTGLVAWAATPRGTRAKLAGMWHSTANALVLMLFTASWFIRILHSWVPSPAALLCGLAGMALAGITSRLVTVTIVAAPVATVPRQPLRR